MPFFGLTTAAFDKFERKISYNVIAQERLRRPDALQAINQVGETIILSGVVFAQFFGISQLDELREIGFQMKPIQLVTGYGDVLGCWYLTAIDEEQQALLANGVPRKQPFSVEAKFSVSSEGDQLDTLCYAHYGHLKGTVKAVLQTNPGLSAIQKPYSIGITIRFPDLRPMSTESINL